MNNLPSVLVVCDLEERAAFTEPLRLPMATGGLRVLAASDPQDAVAQFSEHHPEVVVVSATLREGDSAAFIETVRAMVGRAEVAVVIVGDLTGPMTSALDAADLGGDRFVSRPLAAKALRYAVAVSIDAARLARGGRISSGTPHEIQDDPTDSYRQAQRARWARLADSIADSAAAEGGESVGERGRGDEAPYPDPRGDQAPPGLLIQPRRYATSPIAILADPALPDEGAVPGDTADLPLLGSWPEFDPDPQSLLADEFEFSARSSSNRVRSGSNSRSANSRLVRNHDPSDDLVWSGSELLAQLREATRESVAIPVAAAAPVGAVAAAPVGAVAAAPAGPPGGREFSRQLRQKMSVMAQRLFAHQGPSSGVLDAAPQHDHQIEFDLAALVEEPELSDAPDIVESRTGVAANSPPLRQTQPGTWNGGVRDARDRTLPDSGDLARGVSDIAAVVVRMWAQNATGRVVFRRGDLEKIVFFDEGRPVFASSTELHDRMGELLYREGKITHAQYMHSKSLVAESGRRMGEILVDLGYLKGRELYPAVRRHVEDIIYSLFGWDHGSYRIVVELEATSERIRLARHPAAIVLEGIRRKFDRSVLDRLVGPASTVLELTDRERLRGLVTAIELTSQERSALAAIDGHSDLPAIARAAGLTISAVLPLAWALVILGCAIARRDSVELIDESVPSGETDLAIDRERVRARWQLVAEADYFTLLGVRRDATSFEIRRSYESSRRDFAAEGFASELRRELARELDDIATVLDEAFRVLCDDPLRREYLAHLVD